MGCAWVVRLMGLRGRHASGTRVAFLVDLTFFLAVGQAPAQEDVRNFTDPILVLGTEGHSGPLRSIVFLPDGQTLLSAGLDKVVQAWAVGDGRPRLLGTIRPPIWTKSVRRFWLSTQPTT